MKYTPVPATQQTITRYAAFLSRSLKFSSVKQYMNIIRLLHLEWDLPNPMSQNFHLQSVLRGMRRSMGDSASHKLPITPDILRHILSQLDLSDGLDANVWAVCLFLFFGLLRKGSVLPVSSKSDYNKIVCREDITFHKWGVNSVIRTTKTIQFNQRTINIPLPICPNSVLCPVQALFHAFSFVPSTAKGTPAFVVPGRSPHRPEPIVGKVFVGRVHSALKSVGMDTSRYSGHSFRRGGATWAYSIGLPAETIRVMGDWRSSAYLRYLEIDSGIIFNAVTKMQKSM